MAVAGELEFEAERNLREAKVSRDSGEKLSEKRNREEGSVEGKKLFDRAVEACNEESEE